MSLNAIRPNADSSTSFQDHVSGMFLEKPGVLKRALDSEYKKGDDYDSYVRFIDSQFASISSFERSMAKLESERVDEFVDNDSDMITDEISDENSLNQIIKASIYSKDICSVSQKDPVIVMIRHGKKTS